MPNEIELNMDGKNTEETRLVIAGPELVLPDADGASAREEIVVFEEPVDRPDGNESERVTAFMGRFEYAKDARSESGVEEEWAEAEALYNQEDDRVVEGEWRSDAFVPHATREVNNATPHMLSAVLDADQLARITAPNQANEDYASCEERVVTYQLQNKMDLENGLELVAQQTALLGTSVAFVGFRVKKLKFKRMVEMEVSEGITAMKEVEEEHPVEAHNTFVPLDITDVWVDPNATPTYLPRMFYYERKSIRQIKDSGLPYKNLDKLSEFPPTMKQFFDHDFSSGENQIGSRRQNDVEQDALPKEDRLHHLLHEWDCEAKTWSVVADGGVELLAPRPWPTEHLPFVFFWYQFAPGNRFYGRGVVKPVSKSCRNANRLRRQRDDNVELCLNKMFLVRTGAVMDEQAEFRWQPGGLIHVRGGSLENAVKVLEMGDVTQSSYQDERIIKGDIEDVNGLSNISMGRGDSKARTATGTSILRQMAVLRLRGPVRRMMVAMRRVVENMIANNQRYIPKLTNAHLLGKQADLYAMYQQSYKDGVRIELNLHPAHLYDNTEVQNAQFLNSINVLGKLGMLQYIEPKALTKHILKKMGGVSEVDPLLRPEEQTYSAQDFMAIVMESQALMRGESLEPKPEDRHAAHIEVHRQMQSLYPDTASLLEAHVQAHMTAQQAAAMGMPGMVPGLGASGGGPQPGVNANRASNPTSDEGATRTAGNVLGQAQQ